MDSSLFDYHLPAGRIAQRPPVARDLSRLMILERKSGLISVDRFFNLSAYLKEGDLVVVNDSRVMPARFFGVKTKTKGKVEVLVTGVDRDGYSVGLAKGRIRPGEILEFEGGYQARVKSRDENRISLEWLTPDKRPPFAQAGHLPTPPYIKRRLPTPLESMDRQRYQTIFARAVGSVAAPTAGLHFSPRVLDGLKQKGVRTAAVTLHVGPGTFVPISTRRIEDHHLEAEWYHVPESTAALINTAKEEGRRVVAVGTTVVRVLESTADSLGRVEAGEGWTDLFITPGFQFRVIEALVTNFHLPRSSLLVLVSAFAGREKVMEAYQKAVESGFRFYSYGDAMLIV